MVKRLRSTGLAGTGALLLVLVIAGIAAGRTVLAEVAPTATIASFEDTNGDGIDDDCQEGEVADEAAALAAELVVDLNGDGTISTSEAAQSVRIGGKNCNHGGYVSWVSQGSCVPVVPVAAPVTGVTGPLVGAVADGATTTTVTCAEEAPTTEVAPTTECVEIPPPERDPLFDTQKNGHGKWVSTVAGSEAIGGKNCNHGGAVSDAAKKDHAAAAAAREAAKAERKAAHDAAKLAREQARGKPRNH